MTFRASQHPNGKNHDGQVHPPPCPTLTVPLSSHRVLPPPSATPTAPAANVSLQPAMSSHFAYGNPSFCPTHDAICRTHPKKKEHPEFAPAHTLQHSDIKKEISNTRMYNFRRPQLQNTNFPKHAAHATSSRTPPPTGPCSAEAK